MILRNRRGSALVAVLVMVAILTILGVTLGSAALNDQRQAKRQQKNNEAFYLARSGAEAVAALLLKNQGDIGSYIGQTTESVLGNGKFIATVEDGGGKKILIHSTGYSGDFSEKVTLSLVYEGSSWWPVLDSALFTEGSISLTGSAKVTVPPGSTGVSTNNKAPGGIYIAGGGSIVGNVLVGPEGVPDQVIVGRSQWDGGLLNVTGDLGSLPEERDYPLPEFPQWPATPVPDTRRVVNTPSAQNYLNEDGEYSRINITDDRKLSINVPAGQVWRIYVDTLSLGGHIILPGEGRLELYVDKLIWDGGGRTINQDGDPTKLMIYYRGSADPMITNNIKIWGFLYAERSDLTMGSNAAITGGIIIGGSKVSVVGDGKANVTAYYAPNADFIANNSGHVSGAVVSKTFTSNGGGAGITFVPQVKEIWEALPGLGLVFDPGALPGVSAGYRLGGWSD